MARVVVVGSINVDLVVRAPRLPRAGETVTEGTFSRGPGGKGGNQAAAAARLGAEVAMVGAVGRDEHGDLALDDLRRAGVDVALVQRVDRPTGVAAIVVDEQGENQIAVAPGANRAVDAETVRAGLGRLLEPGAVVVAALELEPEAVDAAAAGAEAAGCRFVLNPAPARRLSLELLARVSVLTPNEHEAASLVPGVEDPAALPVEAVVVTQGAAGCTVYRRGRDPVHRPAFPVEVVDTTGAGDAFTAGVAWALADGRGLDEAVRLASAAGALATRGAGARGGLGSAAEVIALAGGPTAVPRA